jgi:hypothetical protein
MWKTFSSVADPDPGSGAFSTPGSGIRAGKKSRSRIRDPGSGSGMNIPDLIFDNLLSVFWVQILLSESDSGSCQPWIRDLGWKKLDPGSWIREGKIGSRIRNTDSLSIIFTEIKLICSSKAKRNL